MKRFIFRIILTLLIVGGVWIWYRTPDTSQQEVIISAETTSEETQQDLRRAEEALKESDEGVIEKIQQTVEGTDPLEEETASRPVRVDHDVPFIVQAPKAQWEDQRFQDACEEASMLMAHAWVAGEKRYSRSKATSTLEELFALEEQFFGFPALDTSAADTARFLREHYGYSATVKEWPTIDDIYNALAAGQIVIAPSNGQQLGNPHFSGAGPERHMLVIRGYDLDAEEFITNDPGTRNGKGYRYGVAKLFNAIRDYPSGHKVPLGETKKAVIFVSR